MGLYLGSSKRDLNLNGILHDLNLLYVVSDINDNMLLSVDDGTQDLDMLLDSNQSKFSDTKTEDDSLLK